MSKLMAYSSAARSRFGAKCSESEHANCGGPVIEGRAVEFLRC